MNIKQDNIILLFSLLFSISASGCGSAIKPGSSDYIPTDEETRNECLPPLTEFAFPIGGINDNRTLSFRDETLPAGEWKQQTELPVGFNFPRFGNIVTSSDNNVWITGTIDHEPVVIKYIEKIDKWTIYYGIDNNDLIAPYFLYSGSDGTLWGVDVRGKHGNIDYDAGVSLISLFDETTNEFISVEDLNHTFEEIDFSYTARQIREDQDGNLYILLNYQNGRKAILRYDTSTKKSELVLEQPKDSWIVDFVITSDNTIWMVDAFSDNFLLKYDLNTEELQSYIGTFSFRPGDDLVYDRTDDVIGRHTLLLDQSERLWVDDRGWLEDLESTYPSWHRIIRSPLFIVLTYGDNGYPFYYWERPQQTYQSSDGLIWFSSYAGVIKLNPKNGEWCLFTTYYSPVHESQNGNLWLIADKYLYKLEISK